MEKLNPIYKGNPKDCPRCKKRGKTWPGSNPRCAFRTGKYSTDNWNCATMDGLRDLAEEERETYQRDDMNAGSFGFVHFSGGYICMSWYKSRGRTARAIVMRDDIKPHVLTLKEAEQALKEAKDE